MFRAVPPVSDVLLPKVLPARLSLAQPPFSKICLGVAGTAGLAIAGLCAPSFWQLSSAIAQAPLDPEIKVGIIQRFGANAKDKIEVKANAGDQLTIKMVYEGKTETLQTDKLTFDIQPKPLPKPQLSEQLVLSTHRSFESAEDSANQWRARGIEVELAQPATWEVWAKRDVYSIPVVRRMLLNNLKAEGYGLPYMKSTVLQSVPQAGVVVNFYRYNRDEVEISGGAKTLLVNGAPYPGKLRLQRNAYGSYTLVNKVQVEDYLRGVVPHEIGPSAPMAAVEAQTILARTYALRNLRRFTVDNYEMCATTQCQVYFGWKDPVPTADQAIANTRGLVLTYNNELIDAVYSSTTGGVTAAFTDVWNGASRPYLQPVVDSVAGSWNLGQKSLADEKNLRQFIGQKQGFNEDGWNYFRWTKTASLKQLNGDLKKYLSGKQHPLKNFTTIRSMQVVTRSSGGRIRQLQVVLDNGQVMLEKDEVIRAFEAPNSLLCYLDPLAEAGVLTGYRFTGGGLGHGVGLSQTGSYKLAQIGWNRDKILSFYYPNTQLLPLNRSITFWREPQR